MTEEVTKAEAAPGSPDKNEPEAVVKEAGVIEEVTKAEDAPESPVKEHDAIVEKTIVTEEVT